MGIVRAVADRAIDDQQQDTESGICQAMAVPPPSATAPQRPSSESFWRAIEALEAAEKAIALPWQLQSK